MAYIEVRHSAKCYGSGEQEIIANQDVTFDIEKGELVIILGSSGAGKSTLLNILGGMDTNDEGQVIIDGVDIAQLNSHQRTNYRRDDVGFVFQFYNLVANLNAKENVELASEIVKDAMDPGDRPGRDIHRQDGHPSGGHCVPFQNLSRSAARCVPPSLPFNRVVRCRCPPVCIP